MNAHNILTGKIYQKNKFFQEIIESFNSDEDLVLRDDIRILRNGDGWDVVICNMTSSNNDLTPYNPNNLEAGRFYYKTKEQALLALCLFLIDN